MALIADVFIAQMIDKDGQVFASTTLQSGDIDFNVKENEVRGGRGNALQGVLHSDRDISVKMTDSLFRYDWMARQLGQSIVTGAGKAYAMPEWYTASGSTTIKISLPEAPIADTLAIYKADGTPIPKANYTLSSKDVTFTTGVTAGEKVEVRTFQYATSAKTETINIDNSVFARGTKLVLETLEIDNDETPLYKIQYIFESAVPTGNFSVKTASERNGQAQQFDLKVLKPKDSNVIGQVVRIPLA
ncbi:MULTISPECIES: hypothetical protein [unclassified Paenibacillus]|uniref:hypothetical protein n=1 Tax=unclassified Paenibacillus TaxID=185978 RepID=UPI00020D7007|nr:MULTISPECIES: hypothetical protein [unclassified Paenibacillus]EGL20084.1 hypothetical protein HMPREF9413_1081 [Paenibacillus sp. HGF7]EPD82024.1 hypothetical protein HMPREF1207_03850 [Paenibacillus sp. HGH0039]